MSPGLVDRVPVQCAMYLTVKDKVRVPHRHVTDGYVRVATHDVAEAATRDLVVGSVWHLAGRTR